MKHFNANTDIPLLTDKVILVTGGTDRLGKESIRQFCQHSPSHIYLAGRNKSKAESVLADLDKTYPNHAPIIFLDMDLSSLASVKSAATKFLSSHSRLDILMCNAGLAGLPTLTEDGYERTFATNHPGHALLIQLLLLPSFLSIATTSADVRVITLSSVMERFAPAHYTFDRMHTSLTDLTFMARYGQSKLANTHYTMLLAQQYPGLTFLSVHPGNVRSNFKTSFSEGHPWIEALVSPVLSRVLHVAEVEEGARGQIWCAVAKREELRSGEFYWPVGVVGKGSVRSRGLGMEEELGRWTDEQLKGWM